MRIGIDCRTILNPGLGEAAGVGHYTYFLLKNLLEIDHDNEYVLFFDRIHGTGALQEIIRQRPKVLVKFFPFYKYKKLMPFLHSHVLVSNFVNREKCDVFHSPSGHLPYFCGRSAVITIHDLAIYRHPEWFRESKFELFVSTKIFLPRSIRLSKFVIVPSKSTADDLGGVLNVPIEKIKVIPHGVSIPKTDSVNIKFNLGEKYIFFLGTIEPRKNLVFLIRSFHKFLDNHKEMYDVNLILAGALGWKYQEVLQEIEKVNKTFDSKKVIYLGYVSTSDKFALMKGARVFVFPSLYEGFGLPVLEAMAMGTPVITSDVSSLPEVTGDAAILINQEDEEKLSSAVYDLFNDNDLWLRYSELGRIRANNFSWEKTARLTLDTYYKTA